MAARWRSLASLLSHSLRAPLKNSFGQRGAAAFSLASLTAAGAWQCKYVSAETRPRLRDTRPGNKPESSNGQTRSAITVGGVSCDRLLPKADGKKTPLLVCLPTPSFICDKSEWEPASSLLGSYRPVVACGLPGFGEAAHAFPSKPSAAWYMQWCAAALKELSEKESRDVYVVASGHAAGWILALGGEKALGNVAGVVLVAPTCVGPMPTVTSRMTSSPVVKSCICATLEYSYRLPGLGNLLQLKFTSQSWIRQQLVTHVYTDQSFVTPEFLELKRGFARAKRSRRMAISYVVGNLDAFPKARTDGACEALRTMQSDKMKVGVLMPTGAPKSSAASMRQVADTADPSLVMSVPGSLVPHEEFPQETVAAIESLLKQFESK